MFLVSAAAQAEEGAAKGEWFGGLRQVKRGSYLDLDNGGLFASQEPFPGGRAEMAGDALLCATEEDPGFAALAPVLSRAPWVRVATSAGHTSWVQLLRPAPDAIVHFLTRLGGSGRPAACPRAPYAIGRTYSIELRFEASSGCRIERSDDFGLSFREIAASATSPFTDGEVEERRRYVYRLCALDEGGRRGVPATLVATGRSRGVAAGEVELDSGARRSADLMLGECAETGWDLQLVSVWDRGITVRQSERLFCMALGPSDDRFAPAWEGGSAREWQIAPGDSFLAPLRGGGVALCRLASLEERRATIAYEAYGDGFAMPRPPEVAATAVEGGVRLRVTAPDPWFATEVLASDRPGGGAPRRLRLVRGEAFDEAPAALCIRVYEAPSQDDNERRGCAGRAMVNSQADSVRDGTCELAGVGAGYSFTLGADAGRPDCELEIVEAHGEKPIFTLRAPEGMCVVAAAADIEPLFDGVVGAIPDEVALERVESFSLQPGEELLLLVRTAPEGWAKVALRTSPGRLSLRFAHNPRACRFGPLDGAQRARGLLLSGIGEEALPAPG